MAISELNLQSQHAVRYAHDPACQEPLRPHIDGFADRVREKSYSKQAIWKKVRLVSDLSRWMGRKRLQADRLNEQQTARLRHDSDPAMRGSRE